MEKAKEKATEVKIAMKDGSTRTLATIQQSELENVKLDGKEENGAFTSVALKRGIISDDGITYVEQRLFRYAPSKAQPKPKTVCYPLPLPLTEVEFNKIAFSTRLDNYVKAERVEQDHAQSAGEGLSSEFKNFVVLAKKVEKGETLTAEEKASMTAFYMKQYGAPEEEVKEVKKEMQAHGLAGGGRRK